MEVVIVLIDNENPFKHVLGRERSGNFRSKVKHETKNVQKSCVEHSRD
jgi:hypothetical protein